MRARSASAALSESFEREPIETYIFLPSGEKTMSRVQYFLAVGRENDVARPMSATAKKGCATRKLRTQFFGRAARFEVAVPVGKTNDAVSVRDVQELRIVTGRIKRDSEWLI